MLESSPELSLPFLLGTALMASLIPPCPFLWTILRPVPVLVPNVLIKRGKLVDTTTGRLPTSRTMLFIRRLFPVVGLLLRTRVISVLVGPLRLNDLVKLPPILRTIMFN